MATQPTPAQQALMAKNWRDLIRPRTLDLEDRSETYGKFVCEPLERGFGITLGNSLRRILLSSLQGAAITAIKIEGALHEFQTLPDVVEDVNPDHHIATLSRGGKLHMELHVGMGRGYVPAERNKTPNMPLGTIPID